MKQYTLVVFEDNKEDLDYIKNAFHKGRVKVMSNFPEIGFEKIDDFTTELLEADLLSEEK